LSNSLQNTTSIYPTLINTPQTLNQKFTSNIINRNTYSVIGANRSLNKILPYSKPLLKYLFTKIWLQKDSIDKRLLDKGLVHNLNTEHFFFTERFKTSSVTNLIPLKFFNYKIKKKVLRIFSYDKLPLNITFWYYTTLVRFFEVTTGLKVQLKFNPFIINLLPYTDVARSSL
tara:strand:+ start:114 stop:629 length:516 start_codon:yes stop_codon:yes gene_type:complete